MPRRHRIGLVAVAALLAAATMAVATRRFDDSEAVAVQDPPSRPRTGHDVWPEAEAEVAPRVDAAVPKQPAAVAGLSRLDTCGALVDRLRADALSAVTPYGLAVPNVTAAMGSTGGGSTTTASSGAPASSASATAGGDSASGAFSTTNVQEAGVDEPDVVKNDGRWAFAINDGTLRSSSISADRVEPGDELDLGAPAGSELLDVDSAIVVLSPSANGLSTSITFVDAADPRQLRVTDHVDVEGAYLSARRVGRTVRLVVTQNGPAFAFTYPRSNDARDVERALEHNRSVVRRALLAEWLPDVTFESGDRLIPAPKCRDAYVTSSFAGPGSTTVLTVSPERHEIIDATSVMATAREVYSTADHLYVATTAWRDGGELTTELHRFDISDPSRSVYEASGAVPGSLLRPPWFVGATHLGQWALSELDGNLRVATTIHNPTTGGIDNGVTVLRRLADRLVPIGTVRGFGVNEQLYAVRFMGGRGYVVTYRKVDPLVVLDLSTPTAPRVIGELKMPGYSAYLHPVGDGLLLGIGQADADEDGLADGTQVSLFDVSDPSHPRLLDAIKLGDRGSLAGAEADHRSFTWWPATREAVLTMTNWNDRTAFHGAVVLRVGSSSIDEVGRIEHRVRDDDRCATPVTRSRIVGDGVLTFSAVGIDVNALADVSRRDQLRYPGARSPDCPSPQEPPPTTNTTTSTTTVLPAGGRD